MYIFVNKDLNFNQSIVLKNIGKANKGFADICIIKIYKNMIAYFLKKDEMAISITIISRMIIIIR